MKTLLSIALILIAAQSFALNLSWQANDPAQNVTGYNVYQVNGTNFTLVNQTPITATTFALTGSNASAGLIYAVTAINVMAESAKSNQVTIPAAPTAPAGLKLTP